MHVGGGQAKLHTVHAQLVAVARRIALVQVLGISAGHSAHGHNHALEGHFLGKWHSILQTVVVVEHVAVLRRACVSSAPRTRTADSLLFHVSSFLLHRRSPRGKELQCLCRLRENAHLQQQATYDHARPALATLAVNSHYVFRVAVEPVLNETHNGIDLICGSSLARSSTQRTRVMVFNGVPRETITERNTAQLTVAILRAKVDSMPHSS